LLLMKCGRKRRRFRVRENKRRCRHYSRMDVKWW
jgi:hypothetical protein